MATGDALIKVVPVTAQIFKPPAIGDPGVYPTPIPFGGMGRSGQPKRILRPFPNLD
jgi:hypothetical protein